MVHSPPKKSTHPDLQHVARVARLERFSQGPHMPRGSGAPSTWRDAIYVSIWIPVLRDDFCHQLEGIGIQIYT